jgi:hypothetical protein
MKPLYPHSLEQEPEVLMDDFEVEQDLLWRQSVFGSPVESPWNRRPTS